MFFKNLQEVMPDGMTINLTVSRKENELTVLVTSNNGKDKIVPMTIKGTAEELDKGFSDSIGKALKSTAGIVASTKAYEAELKKKQDELKKSNENLTKPSKTKKAGKKANEEDEGTALFGADDKNENKEGEDEK